VDASLNLNNFVVRADFRQDLRRVPVEAAIGDGLSPIGAFAEPDYSLCAAQPRNETCVRFINVPSRHYREIENAPR